MAELSELLRVNEVRFQRSSERLRYALSASTWREIIQHAITGDPKLERVSLRADSALGSGKPLGEGVVLQSEGDGEIQQLATMIANQANALLPQSVWSPGRVSRHFTYYRDPHSEKRHVLLDGLHEALARQIYPPLVGLGG